MKGETQGRGKRQEELDTGMERQEMPEERAVRQRERRCKTCPLCYRGKDELYEEVEWSPERGMANSFCRQAACSYVLLHLEKTSCPSFFFLFPSLPDMAQREKTTEKLIAEVLSLYCQTKNLPRGRVNKKQK